MGTGGHGRIGPLGACGVPVLVIGPAWRPGDGVTRRVVVGLHGPTVASDRIAAVAAVLADRLGAELTMIEVVGAGWRALDVPACAHLDWVARELPAPTASFDTVAAERADDGLGRFLGVATVAVVGASSHHRGLLGGVAGRLLRRSPGPVLVVPSLGSDHGGLPVPRAARSVRARRIRRRRRARPGRARPLGVPPGRRWAGVRRRTLEHAGGIVIVIGIEVVGDAVWHVLDDPGVELAGDVVVHIDAAHRSRVAQLHTDSHVLNAIVYERWPGTLVTGAQINADGTGRMDFDLSEVDNDTLPPSMRRSTT